ncbi:MAG: hypothetical protein GTN89_07115 [Acidobacteria bacterium]|nr:hypothetical protein [Acidobacteriota bacterium]NIO59094.1 hypothetical protein [Acidobacteriota bacterium]NIQ30129.1 hypothetical protein [Acidobacteriota bacterium]NIQ84940.1 hypothetical protein [Acidobacteriota bacterium]
MSGPSLVSAAGLAVVATQKARFYVDARGIVQREEYGPRKYKKGRN